MPAVAVGLLALFLALTLLAFWASYTQAFRPLLEGLAEHVPVVGKYIRQSIVSALDYAARQWERLLDTMLGTIVDWFDGLAGVARQFYVEVRQHAETLAADVAFLVDHRIPDAIAARLAPVAEIARDGKALAVAVDDRLDRFRTRVLDVELPSLGRGIDRLRDRVLEVELPKLARGIDRIDNRVDALRDRTAGLVRDVGQIGTVAIPGLRAELGAARRLLDDVRSWVTPVSAVFAGAAVVELLRHVARCKPKTERLCTLDLDDVDELLGLALLFPMLDELVAAMRAAARGADEIVDGFKLLR